MQNLISDDYYPFLQNNHFYKAEGNLFCLKVTCEDCEHISKCMNVEQELDSLPKTHIRRSISYAKSPKTEFVGDTTKVLVKRFQDRPHDGENILYDFDTDSYICISGTCSGCEHFNKGCEPEIQVKDHEPVIFSMDLQAQEPRCYAMLSQEPKWVELFQNDSIRNIPFLYEAVSKIFNLILEVDTNQEYWKFLDLNFFEDKTDLYALVNSLLSDELEQFLIVSEYLLLLFSKQNMKYAKDCEQLIPNLGKHFEDVKTVLQDTSIKFPKIGDFHGANAAALFGREPVEQAFFNDPVLFKDYYRDKAKQCGLALNYGGTTRVIMNAVGCSEPEAEVLFNSYFSVLIVFLKYLQDTWKKALKNLFITTMVGRRIFIPELAITDKKLMWKKYSEGKNNVYNYPIQGSSAEMVRIMLIRAYTYFSKFKTTKYDINYVAGVTQNSNLLCVDLQETDIEALSEFIDKAPLGNCKIIVLDGQEVRFEADRSISVTWEQFKQFNMREAL